MTIRKLREAVEAGDWLTVITVANAVFPCADAGVDSRNKCFWVQDAYRGSHDAAQRLHDTLLPGWWAMLRHSTRPSVTIGYVDAVQEAQDESLSRAWLLAILRAMEGRDG